MEPEKEPENAPETEPAVGDKRARATLLLKRFLKQLLSLSSLIQSWKSRVAAKATGILQRLRGRFGKAPQDQADEEPPEESRRGKPSSSDDLGTQQAEAPKVPAPPVRNVYIYLLVLLIGGFAGMTFSFSLFSRIIFNQAEKIDSLHGDMIVLEQENAHSRQSEARSQQSEADYRDELLATQKKLEETESDLRDSIQNARKNPGTRFSPAHPASRTEPSGTAFPEYKAGKTGVSSAASAGSVSTRSQPKSSNVAQKSGTCDISAGHVESTLANCIKALKPE